MIQKNYGRLTFDERIEIEKLLSHKRSYADFADFVTEQQKDEAFESFQSSSYIDKKENYKNQVFKEAKEKRDQGSWKEADIGTGKIQQKK